MGIRLIKCCLISHNALENNKLHFCTGLTGDSIMSILDNGCDHVSTDNDKVIIKELDAAQMDSSVDVKLKGILNEVLEVFRDDLNLYMGLPNRAFEMIVTNA